MKNLTSLILALIMLGILCVPVLVTDTFEIPEHGKY